MLEIILALLWGPDSLLILFPLALVTLAIALLIVRQQVKR